MGKTKPGDDLQKLKSRVAAKNRRKYENEQIEELVLMNPWIMSNPPDKSTIIRLTTSFIGLMKVLNSSCNVKKIGDGSSSSEGIEKLCLEALDGFIIILSKEGRITYANEKTLIYLGYIQNEMLGKSIYNFVLQKDWEIVAKKLKGPLPSLDNPNIKQPQVENDDEICDISGEELFVPYFENTDGFPLGDKKVQFSVRIKCNMARRNNSKSSNFRVLRFTGNIGITGDFAGLAQPAWSPDVGDLPIHQSVFITRLSPDLKLLFCEGRIHRYMDTEAKDIVGRAAYPFYHPKDIFYIQKLHSKLLAKGQCVTEPYRWMNKGGGLVWMESKVRQIKCEKTGRFYMLCVNHVLSAVESKGVVLSINPPTEETIVETDRKENEHDSNDAHIFDPLVETLTQNVKQWSITEKNDEPAPYLQLEYEEPESKYEEPETKYEEPETIASCSTELPQLIEPCDEEDFLLLDSAMSPDDVQEHITDTLNEGNAFFAAEYFMGTTIDNLFTVQNLSASVKDTVISSGDAFHGQDTISSRIIDLQSQNENELFMDSSSDSTNQSDTTNEVKTTLDFDEPQDIDLYTLEFNTQFLN